jgi:hypothetical protein
VFLLRERDESEAQAADLRELVEEPARDAVKLAVVSDRKGPSLHIGRADRSQTGSEGQVLPYSVSSGPVRSSLDPFSTLSIAALYGDSSSAALSYPHGPLTADVWSTVTKPTRPPAQESSASLDQAAPEKSSGSHCFEDLCAPVDVLLGPTRPSHSFTPLDPVSVLDLDFSGLEEFFSSSVSPAISGDKVQTKRQPASGEGDPKKKSSKKSKSSK